MPDLDLGMIGNCTYSALIDRQARVVWCCLPRFDADPVFSSLMADGDDTQGVFAVDLLDFAHSEQHYVPNTAILVTRLYDRHGGALEITDFAPRFIHHERMYRPTQMVRQLRPLSGAPRIRVRLRPRFDYAAQAPARTRGSNHVRYVGPESTLRLNTDLPVSFITEEVPFILDRPATLLLGPDESLREALGDIGREFAESTEQYWRGWTRSLSIPLEWQEVVIRAAITLKLSSFEESGAIVAAMTTSIPEAPHSGRNWDYRLCWLRDAYFTVNALNRLGATRTMERFLGYIGNIVASAPQGQLQPVYGLLMERDLTERTVQALPGYRGMGPVRAGNQAYAQVQHDVYGSVLLSLAQLFFDQRLDHPGTRELFERFEPLGDRAFEAHDQPDAGLWELRNTTRVHTFSAVMCWAACDRLARIARHLQLADRAEHWSQRADLIHQRIVTEAWSDKLGGFAESFGGEGLDASLLLLPTLHFLPARDPRFLGTLKAIESGLRRGQYMFRYIEEDDFGHPENAFNICTFWYVEALSRVGRRDEAREIFENMVASRNHLGLLSEDIDPQTGALWGNFPQTYSMVGLIQSAMHLSQPWEDAF